MLETRRDSNPSTSASAAAAIDGPFELRVLHGPSLFAPHPAVVLEWAEEPDVIMARPQVSAMLAAVGLNLPMADLAAASGPDGAIPLRKLAACFARWLDFRGSTERRPPLMVSTTRWGDRSAVAAWFLDETRTTAILRSAWQLARIVDACLRGAATRAAAAEVAVVRDRGTVPADFGKEFAKIFLHARRRGIPSVLLPGTRKVILLGEGRHGRLIRGTTNDRDSTVGTELAIDKFASNAIVARLGFPAVRHAIVTAPEQAAVAAAVIGFPLVVKPVDNGKGTGVFAGITSVEECAAAIHVARRLSTKGVLVEGHVNGDDHRLSVFGGKLAWVVMRRPPAVTGDGSSTVAELIARENDRRRSLPPGERPFQTMIEIDAELSGHLAKSGLGPGSVPAAGRTVTLRSIANVSKGGTYEDVSDRVHPDNAAMAEAIAAAFRMDAVGIDYLTTDISRSWRETGGAIIEVNQTPAAGTPHYFDAMLARLFPAGTPTRVPYAIVANDPGGAADTFVEAQTRRGQTVGFLNATTTLVGGRPRGRPGQSVTQRMQSLILDPQVTLIVAQLSNDDLAREGVLREAIDKVLLGPATTPAVEQLLRKFAGEVVAV